MNSNKYMMLDSRTMEIKEITKKYESTYEMLKDGVGGWIEHILIGALGERGIDIWINEEGKLINLPETVAITDETGKILDVLCGNIVFTRTDDEGETIPLTDEDAEFIRTYFDRLNRGILKKKEGNAVKLIPVYDMPIQ